MRHQLATDFKFYRNIKSLRQSVKTLTTVYLCHRFPTVKICNNLPTIINFFIKPQFLLSTISGDAYRPLTVHAHGSVATRYQLQWGAGEGGGLQVNKFEQVSSLGHQMSLSMGCVQWGPMFRESEEPGLGFGSLHREVNPGWVMVTGDPPPQWHTHTHTHTHTNWKHNLLANSLAGCN